MSPSQKREGRHPAAIKEVAAPQYHADQAFLGDGLFPVAGQGHSYQQARKILGQITNSKYSFPKNTIRKFSLPAKLKRICHSYWHEKAYYHRTPIAKQELIALGKFKSAAAEIVGVLEKTHRGRSIDPVRGYVWATIRGGLKSHLQDFDRALPIIHEHLSRISKLPAPPGKKGRHDHVHINNATAKLCRMWAEIGGRPIERNPETVGKGRAIEFVHLGPCFVFDMLRAIDPQVEFKQVRSALRLAAVKVEKATKNTPNSGEIL